MHDIKGCMAALTLSCLLLSCQAGGGSQETADHHKEATGQQEERSVNQQLTARNTEVLRVLKAKDYTALAGYIHPVLGLRCSPYGFIQPEEDLHFSKEAFLRQTEKHEELLWGDYDGSDEPIRLSLAAYMEKFVYNADFLHAEKNSVNEFIGSGNSLNNLREVYPEAPFTENYFSGFDEQYGGMDWCTLRLVWWPHEGQYFLIAIVHDQWTI